MKWVCITDEKYEKISTGWNSDQTEEIARNRV